MKKVFVSLVLALAMTTPALAKKFPPAPEFPEPTPYPTPAEPDWSTFPRQRLHCGKAQCTERLRFLQTLFPGAQTFPRACRIGTIVTPTDQRYIAENMFLVCPKAGVVFEDGADLH